MRLATQDLPSRGSYEVMAMTGWVSWNMTWRWLLSCWKASRPRSSPANANIWAGFEPGRASVGTSPRTGTPSRSAISSAATKRRRVPARSAANTAAMSPNTTDATATVARGFVGLVGSSAAPSSDRTSRVPASRFVTFNTRAAVALAYAWAAAGSVLEALIVTVFEPGSADAVMVAGADW